MQDEENRYAVYRTDEGVWMRSADVHEQSAVLTVVRAAVLGAGLDANDIQFRDRMVKAISPVVNAMLDSVQYRANVLSDAIDAGGWDMSPCGNCGTPVVCLPDGLPQCESCAMRDCS
jgi:hypothetical protein